MPSPSTSAVATEKATAAVVEMVSALYYEQRRETAGQASDRDHRDAAQSHREIYQAIRAHDPEAARRAMNDHLLRARAYQAQERTKDPATRPARARRR